MKIKMPTQDGQNRLRSPIVGHRLSFIFWPLYCLPLFDTYSDYPFVILKLVLQRMDSHRHLTAKEVKPSIILGILHRLQCKLLF